MCHTLLQRDGAGGCWGLASKVPNLPDLDLELHACLKSCDMRKLKGK